MTSYAADLEAIFSAPYDSTKMEEPETPILQGSPIVKGENREPLMASTPQIKPPSINDKSTSSIESTPNRADYQSIEEGAASSDADDSRVERDVERDVETVVDVPAILSPKDGTASSPKTSPTLNIAVNPLNAMANSIAEAFKKRSPTGSYSSFLVSSAMGCKSETTLKYTPLTFDDEEQLPICGGIGNANLNTNNNNSAATNQEDLVANGRHTTYGAAFNRDGHSESGRSGPFVDRISFRSPLSVFTICLFILLVFIGIICLSAIGKKAKQSHVHHAAALKQGKHHTAALKHGEHHTAALKHGEHHTAALKHGEHHPATTHASPYLLSDENGAHSRSKEKQEHIIHDPYVSTKERTRPSKFSNINHQDLHNVLKEMARLSNSTDPHILRVLLSEFKKQLRIVQSKLISVNNRIKQENHLPQIGNNEHQIKTDVNGMGYGNYGVAEIEKSKKEVQELKVDLKRLGEMERLDSQMEPNGTRWIQMEPNHVATSG